ncbi:MAG: hypothetical protein AB7U23_13180 [Dehalococcoidia bacterium]
MSDETMQIQVATANSSLTEPGPDGGFRHFKRGVVHEVPVAYGQKLVASGRFVVGAAVEKVDPDRERAVATLIDRLMGAAPSTIKKLGALLEASEFSEAPAPAPAPQRKAPAPAEPLMVEDEGEDPIEHSTSPNADGESSDTATTTTTTSPSAPRTLAGRRKGK